MVKFLFLYSVQIKHKVDNQEQILSWLFNMTLSIKKMKMMSVMRDIYADIPGYGKHKINSAYALGGPELLRKTLDKNLGINPEYYAVVDFTGFEND